MSKRLERIEADLARARAKRETWDQRVKELEQKYTEEENTEIHEVVRSFNLTPEELREFLQSRRNNASANFRKQNLQRKAQRQNRRRIMRKRNWIAALLAAMLCCGFPVTTVFAQTNEPEVSAASTEEVPEELVTKDTSKAGEEEEPEELPPLTPDGNLTLVDDISTRSGKQFITVVTKNNNYFYLIIDRDDEGNQTVHFLNQVDEEDLFNLLDEEDAKAVQEAMSEQKTQAEETAETPEPTKEPEKETAEPVAETVEKKQNVSLFAAAGVLIIVIGGIAIWIFLQAKKRKPTNQPDPDADYREDEDGYDLPEEEDSDSEND